MKSYTDLEQSRKLAEILPLESADMQWFLEEDYGIVQIKEELQDWGGDCTVPCWSLAALLEVINDDYYTTLYHDGVAWNITAIHHDNVKDKHNVYANTPIDCCVEIILRLHEQSII